MKNSIRYDTVLNIIKFQIVLVICFLPFAFCLYFLFDDVNTLPASIAVISVSLLFKASYFFFSGKGWKNLAIYIVGILLLLALPTILMTYDFKYHMDIIAGLSFATGLCLVNISYKAFDDKLLFLAFLLSCSLALILFCGFLFFYIADIIDKVFTLNIASETSPLTIISFLVGIFLLTLSESSEFIVVASLILSLNIEYKYFLAKSKA